jgi:hypothetical protein
VEDNVVGAQKRAATAVKRRCFFRGRFLSHAGKAKDRSPEDLDALPDFLGWFQVVKYFRNVRICLGVHFFLSRKLDLGFFDKKCRESG